MPSGRAGPSRWTIAARGPTTVRGADGEIALRPKERSVIAALVALHPSPARIDEVIELVWGEHPPLSATKSLHNHISRLRRAAPGLVETDERGYRLAGDTVIDLTRRGGTDEPLASLPDHPATLVHRERLRVAATDLDESELERALSEHPTADLVDSLRRAVDDEPFRERRWWLLASAQAQLGQRRDALRTLDAARRQLAEVGLAPGPALRELEGWILDPDGPAPTSTRPARPRPAIHPHRDDPFVGRAEELDLLAATWREVLRTGRSQAVLVSGPAGSGKTRLVDEFVQRSIRGDDDVRVMWGRHREHGMRALGAITEAIARQLAFEPALLDETSSLRLLLAGDAPPPLNATPLMRTRLGRDLSRLLSSLASEPTVWLLDDLHWASADSVSLLDEVLDGLDGPFLLVGTARSEAQGRQGLLGVLGRSIPVERIALDPLAHGDIEELLKLTSIDADPDGIDAFHHRTGGLALYASELARVARLNGSLDLTTVPTAIRDWMHHRIDLLDPEIADVLRVASIADQSIDVALLALATGRSTVDVAGSCDMLLANGLLTHDPVTGRMMFSHTLTTEIVADSIRPESQRATHRALADALIVLGGHEPARVAHHLASANDRRTHAFAMEAGQRSLGVGAWSHALRHFTTAEAFASTPIERAEALIGLGRGHLGRGDAAAASECLFTAADLAWEHDDAALHARAALLLVGRAGRGAILDDEPRQLAALRRAMNHVEASLADEGTPDAVADLAAAMCDLERELGIALLLTDRRDERERLLESAAARAEQLPVPRPNTMAQALLGLRYAQLGPDDLAARLHNIDRVAAMSPKALDPETRIAAEVYRVEDLVRSGRPDDVAGALDAAASMLRAYPDPYWRWAVETWRVVVGVLDGDLEDAEAAAHEAAALRPDVAEARACLGVNLVNIRLYQHRPGEVIDLLRAAADANPRIPTYRAVLALCAAEAGDDGLARDELSALAMPTPALPDDTNRLVGLVSLAHAAATLGDVGAARPLRDALTPYRGQWAVINCYGGGGAVWGPVDHAIARLSAMTDGASAAEDAFDAAAAASQSAPLALARIERDRAAVAAFH